MRDPRVSPLVSQETSSKTRSWWRRKWATSAGKSTWRSRRRKSWDWAWWRGVLMLEWGQAEGSPVEGEGHDPCHQHYHELQSVPKRQLSVTCVRRSFLPMLRRVFSSTMSRPCTWTNRPSKRRRRVFLSLKATGKAAEIINSCLTVSIFQTQGSRIRKTDFR